MPVIRLVL